MVSVEKQAPRIDIRAPLVEGRAREVVRLAGVAALELERGERQRRRLGSPAARRAPPPAAESRRRCRPARSRSSRAGTARGSERPRRRPVRPPSSARRVPPRRVRAPSTGSPAAAAPPRPTSGSSTSAASRPAAASGPSRPIVLIDRPAAAQTGKRGTGMLAASRPPSTVTLKRPAAARASFEAQRRVVRESQRGRDPSVPASTRPARAGSTGRCR